MEIVQTKDVFTPTKPARLAFIDRESVNTKLVSALQMPGKQLIVYGHSGSGKTTILANKLQQLYEGHITTHCMKGMTFDQLVLDAFDQLEPFYTSEKNASKVKIVNSEVAGKYFVIQTKLQTNVSNSTGQKDLRVLPPQLTPQALGKFLGEAKYCWVLEDFHKIEVGEKIKLAQLMKVFMDLSDVHDELKIVALGAVDTARQVVEYDNEMRQRVAEIQVDLMTESEIEKIITKGELALNISLAHGLKNLVAKYSNGLASVCHHLCLYMCQAAGVIETSKAKLALTQEHFETALQLYVEEASDSIRSAFDKALRHRRKTKFNDAKLVIETLCKFKERGASRSEMLVKIRKKEPKYPEINLRKALEKLATDEYGALTRYDQTAGLHSFADPIFRVFALAAYHENGKSTEDTEYQNISFAKLLQLLENEIGRIKKEIPEGVRR